MFQKHCFVLVYLLLAAALSLAPGAGGPAAAQDPEPQDPPPERPLPPGHPPATPPGHPPATPPGHPPVTTPSSPVDAIPPVPPGSGTGATGLEWKVPAGWTAETPASSMRRAQYRVPGSGGDGECVVFYFGPGQGGDAMANARRWAGQFTQPDGGASNEAMKTEHIEMNGVAVLLVEVTGTYSGGMGASRTAFPDHMLLGAIAAGPDANWFFKLTGPEATLREQKPAFEELYRSLKRPDQH